MEINYYYAYMGPNTNTFNNGYAYWIEGSNDNYTISLGFQIIKKNVSLEFIKQNFNLE